MFLNYQNMKSPKSRQMNTASIKTDHFKPQFRIKAGLKYKPNNLIYSSESFFPHFGYCYKADTSLPQ